MPVLDCFLTNVDPLKGLTIASQVGCFFQMSGVEIGSKEASGMKGRGVKVGIYPRHTGGVACSIEIRYTCVAKVMQRGGRELG